MANGEASYDYSVNGCPLDYSKTIFRYDASNLVLVLLGLFLMLYVIYGLLSLYWYWTFRDHYPIRGRAPLITMLLQSNLLALLITPWLSEVLWKANITNSYSPKEINFFNRLLGTMCTVSRNSLYWVYGIKMCYIHWLKLRLGCEEKCRAQSWWQKFTRKHGRKEIWIIWAAVAYWF